MNTYICFYKGKQYEIQAATSLEAQKKVAAQLNVKHAYKITVMLAALDDKPVVHTPNE